MAANRELESRSLAFKLENGVDDEGNTLYQTKTFSNIKGSVSDDAMYAVAEGLRTVLEKTAVAYYINDKSLLQNN